MRQAAITLIIMLFLGGCTSVVHTLRDEPIEPDPHAKSLGTDLDDFQIETAVGVNIKKAHPLLEKAHVNVHSYNSVVLLTGEVPNAAMRSLAGDTARDFRGVRQVHNELQIQGSTSMLSRANDGWLTTKVRTKLLADKTIDLKKIMVITENGVVYLMGVVPQSLGTKAANVASTTKGVRKVVKVFEYRD